MKNKRYLPVSLSLLALILAGCGGSESPPAQETISPEAAVIEAGQAGGGAFILRTDIPPEKIEGTPMPINVPNLVPAPRQAPTLTVPEGTTLVSSGKPVTSSDDFPIIGDVSLITDGEKDAGEGYYVELLDGLQWVQVDLEQKHTVRGVWVWHFHSQARAYHDVIVQVSDDPTFGSGVTTLFNNDYDNSAGLGRGSDQPYVESRFGKLTDGKGTPARYVRLYSNGNTSNDMNHYIEVEVYGTPLN